MPFQPDYEVPPERQAYTFLAKPKEGWEGIAVLMLHGFMGSPVSSRDMGSILPNKGLRFIVLYCLDMVICRIKSTDTTKQNGWQKQKKVSNFYEKNSSRFSS